MQEIQVELLNEIDLSLLGNEFFIAILNQILLFKKHE